MPPFIQPRLEAYPHGAGRFTLWPTGDPQFSGQLTRCGHYGKAIDSPPNLITGPRGGQLDSQTLDLRLQAFLVCVQPCCQGLDVGTKCGAVFALTGLVEGIGKGSPIWLVVQHLKRTVLTGTARDLDGPHLHPGLGTLTRFGGVIF